jgi:ubiquinone/menaquinone biosynthesis C-methylase UbiE
MSSRRSLWDRYWARRERNLWKATARDGVAGAIDLPRPAQRFVHGFQLKGWVSANTDVLVAAYLSGKKVWEGGANSPRPDVGPTAKQFSTFVPAGTWATGRWARLKVTARAIDAPEAEALTLHDFPVFRGDGGRKLPRWAYGLVWDREAGTLADAMDSVAGYTDRAEWERSGRSTAEHLIKTLNICPKDDVLEVGCGAARVGVHLAPRCRHWTGADVSGNMLRFAASALQHMQNTSLHKLNGFDLSGLADNSADVAYCTAVFMHLDEWDRFRYVQEFHRVLRPGGRVYFDNFDLRSPDGWELFQEMSSLDIAVRPPNVSKASTQQELEWYAQQAGFVDIGNETGQLWITVTATKPGTTIPAIT